MREMRLRDRFVTFPILFGLLVAAAPAAYGAGDCIDGTAFIRPVGFHTARFAAWGIDVEGDVAVAASGFGGGIEVLDLTDPVFPSRVGLVGSSGWTRHVDIVGTIAYVSAGTSGLHIFDIATPSSPTLLHTVPTTGDTRGIEVVGSHVLMLSGTLIEVADVSTPATASIVETFPMATNGTWHGALLGDTFFASDNQAFRSLDVSDPTDITERDNVTIGSAGNHIAAFGTTAILFSEFVNDGMLVFDVASPSSIAQVNSIVTTLQVEDSALIDGHLYVSDANFGNGFRVFDLSTPTAPTEVAHYRHSQASLWGLRAVGSRLYVTNAGTELYVFETGNHRLLNQAGLLASRAPAPDGVLLTMDDTTIWAGDDQGIRIVDVSDPSNPSDIALRVGPQSPVRAVDLSKVGTPSPVDELIVTFSSDGTAEPVTIQLFDTTDPRNPIPDWDLQVSNRVPLPKATRVDGDIYVVESRPTGVGFNRVNEVAPVGLVDVGVWPEAAGVRDIAVRPTGPSTVNVVYTTPETDGDAINGLTFDASGGGIISYDTSNLFDGYEEVDALELESARDPQLNWLLARVRARATGEASPKGEWWRLNVLNGLSQRDQLVRGSDSWTPFYSDNKIFSGASDGKVIQSQPETTTPFDRPAQHWSVNLAAVGGFARASSGITDPYVAMTTFTEPDGTPWIAALRASGDLVTMPGDCTDFVPVDLLSFHAFSIPSGVRLRWTTADSHDHAGFHVYRSRSASGPFRRVNDALVTGSSPYEWIDRSAPASGDLYYRLGEVSTSGEIDMMGLARVSLSTGGPSVALLGRAAPEPFGSATTIPFEVVEPGRVRLEVYDVSGRRVRTLVDESLEMSRRSVRWDGRDDDGRSIADGAYFVRLQQGSRVASIAVRKLAN